ncbi:hypothetical protein ACJMK2_006706 [Sinanodonta woodiana]|uniref:Macro domain-containing protein n=1 Tax=Sinanodonta woodiana TaxID=1069815 RepID=A0ABD3VWS2_SINWO
MSVQTALEKSFCEDLIRRKLFNEAVKMVKESYNLKVEADQTKKAFKIMADDTELLELVENLLQTWLENKKKNKGNSIDDRIKTTKENPVLDITKGHVMWVFWGDLGSQLLSAEIYTKVEKLKGPLIDLEPDMRGQTLRITCNFEVFMEVKKKVEDIKNLVTSSQAGSNKSQKSEIKNSSQNAGSKSIVSTKSNEAEIKANDSKGSSDLKTKMENVKTSSSQAGLDKSHKSDIKNSGDGSPDKDNKYSKGSEIKESAARSLQPKEPNQSTGPSGGQKVSPKLERSNSGRDQSPHSSFPKDGKNDDKLLFCLPSCRTKVFVYEASIINMSGIDAIVNAANDRLLHGGGVAHHISKAAGGDKSPLEIECREYIKNNSKLDVTKNFTSSAGKMPYKGVIHAVGPIWSEYKVKEECAEALSLTIVNVLKEAHAKEFSKIALPAISSGIYGVPKKVCADMYIKGVMDYDSMVPSTHVKEIHFVDINKDILQEIKDAYGRWKPNDTSQDKKAKSSSSELPGQIAKAVHNTSVHSDSNRSEMSTFHLSENTCIKVYVCSIVEVKNVDAIACEVHTDSSSNTSAILKAIIKSGGTNYEEEFNKMVKAKSGSMQDVFIFKTGGSLKDNNISHVIHIKCEKFENIEDMDRLKHLFGQVFECAKKEKLKTIVMPLIGAASLKEPTKDVTYKCSQLFAKTLKDIVESRRKEMNVREIHLVDLDQKLISSMSKAFQELNSSNTDDSKLKREKKVEPVSKSDEPQDHIPKSKPGVGQRWIEVEKGSGICSYKDCKRDGARKCADCGGFLCSVCTTEVLLSQCPFCKK